VSERVVVVGAGIGGLVAAALLAARGVEVTVLERQSHIGGKLRRVDVGRAPIDVGPTVLTLREVFDAVFDACGASLDAAMTLTRADVLARHVWPDGATLDLHADPAASADAVATFAGPGAAREYLAFQDRARAAYETLDAHFIRDPAPSLPRLLLRAGPARLSRLDPYQTYAGALQHAFTDPRLRQLYARYATYVGTSPYEAPATLMLIAHVEQRGVWRIAQGMGRLPQALAELAQRHGAQVRCDAGVAEITTARGRVTGVRLADGERIEATAVIHDGDSGALGEGRFGAAGGGAAPAGAPPARSLSAVTLAVRARVDGRPLSHHTVLFSPDYAAEFAALAQGEMPDDATLYVCAQDRGDQVLERNPRPPAHPGECRDPDPMAQPSKDNPATPLAPEPYDLGPGMGLRRPTGRRDERIIDDRSGLAPERLFFILNAPARGDQGWPDAETVARARAGLERTLARAGVAVDWASAETAVCGPREFEAMAPGTGGALYGPSAAGAFAAFRRPGTRTRVAGLYLAGGTVHPGPGLPMAARSGQAAAGCVVEDWARR
jgi:1-hydroxycarotenoid 3,4-desaturase